MYLIRQEQGTVNGGETPALARHVLPASECTLLCNRDNTQERIELGSVYEIDHTKLPPKTPVQVRSTRVVMVSEKTELNISVRFPSTQSLQRYFSNRIREMHPEMDQRFVMETKLAEKVLFRQVQSGEFSEKKHSQEFWISDCGLKDMVTSNKTGSCLSELKCNGMARWGVRRQVKFINRHIETNEEEEEGAVQEKDEKNVTEETSGTEQKVKRKRFSSRLVPNGENAKLEKQSQVNNTKANKNCKQIVRWSEERYKVAEEKLLEVMKAKGAVYKNPILLPELRWEACKRIGETDLLDHLLKHMAGKMAPGGAERFLGRHNAEGTMEYWLESADLVDFRRETGVQDPYWTSPPAWKQGDCPTQDPVCDKEMKQLKEETSKLERDTEELVSKKQMEEEIAKLRMEIEDELSEKQQQESQGTMVLNPMVTLEKYIEQVMTVSRYVSRIEEEIGKLKTKVEEETKSDLALMISTECCDGTEKKKVQEKARALIAQQQEVVGTEGRDNQGKTDTTEKEAESTAAGEEKAAKRQRLKSGFRICNPQGTLLRPDTASPQFVVNVEDLLMVPIPPSVSSSTAFSPPQLPHYHHHHCHPQLYTVKSLADRRAAKVTLSSTGGTNFSTTTGDKKTITPLNLNDHPHPPTTPLINLNDPFMLEDGDMAASCYSHHCSMSG